MRSAALLALVIVVLSAACAKEAAPVPAPEMTTAEQTSADEASLLTAARNAGVSDQDALKAKAEIDKVYTDTAAKMDQAEAERIARDKAFKDEACVADCGNQ